MNSFDILKIKLDMSDVLFHYHIKTMTNLNIIFNIVNLLIIILSTLLKLWTHSNIMTMITTVIVILNVIYVLINCAIHDIVYKKTKQELKEVEKMLDKLEQDYEK